jgi:hypothetical protein
MKKYYKVCTSNSDGRYTSAVQNSDFPETYRTEYKIGEFVGPTVAGTRLFVFNNLESARAFRKSFSSGVRHEIFECEVKNPVRIKKIPAVIDVLNYWKRRKLHRKIRDYIIFQWNAPSNSYTASEVKLIRIV